MDELYFLGMDVVDETKSLVDFTMITCTSGMTDNELAAYQLGVNNVMSTLKTVLSDSGLKVINITGLDTPTELSIDDIEQSYFNFY